ncbi:MAG TPA: Na/Pi symporter [Chthoniobacterales bacterium]|nr:Na/Pi symporter [Chthoniobacterales bacterium]
MSSGASNSNDRPHGNFANFVRWIFLAALVYLLLIAVSTIGAGFARAAGERAKSLFDFAENPFAGLVIGIVATGLIQSSSTVSSIIVGLVAGGLPVYIAVPMIVGSNIGTSVTNTIVSLGHIHVGEEFRRAFAAATIHDLFNLLAAAILLPLEILFHPLQRSAVYISEWLLGSGNIDVAAFDFMRAITRPTVRLITGATSSLPQLISGIVLIVIGIAMIFLSISFIGKLLRTLMVGKAKSLLQSSVARGPIAGIIVGTLITVIVQSSSTTTSLIVPLAGTGVFSLRQVYAFTLGANIGTCFTALLAAMAVSGDDAIFALQIALVHLLFNLFGILVVYGIPFLREIPIWGAQRLADAAVKRKLYAVAYLLGLFFLIPAAVLTISKFMGY